MNGNRTTPVNFAGRRIKDVVEGRGGGQGGAIFFFSFPTEQRKNRLHMKD